MVKLHICFAVLLMTLAPFACAANLDMGGMQQNVDNYNKMIDQVPSILRPFLGDELINFEITRNDGSIFRAGAKMVQARIDEIQEGGWPDPSIRIVTTENAIYKVTKSEDPIASFQEQSNLGQIRIVANGKLKQIKLDLVLGSTSVLQFGYNLFFG